MPLAPGRESEGEHHALNASESRRALSAFLLFGVLTSVLGALLPAWGFHLKPDLSVAGNFFLCFNAGLLIAVRTALVLLPRKSIRFLLVLASSLASGAFLFLALISPDNSLAVAVGLLVLGFSAGLLNAAVFHAISPLYLHDRAATTTLAGSMYGLGCFLTVVLVGGTYYIYSIRVILILFAAIPGVYIAIFARSRFSNAGAFPQIPLRHVIEEFKNPGAVLFALILFFQFGNEWSIAGWLPIFLIRRLGISPGASLFMLAFYWGSLLVGRVTAKALLKSVHHGKLLLASVVLALLGCVLLSYTPTRFGAYTGILLIGCGFAPIYPLVVEKISHRFTYYHPGLYNGIFSFAFTGGLLAPFLLGYLAQEFGVGAIMAMPMLGAFMVFVLALLVLLETKLSGDVQVTRARA